MSLPAWSVRNRVAANLSAALLLVTGIMVAATLLTRDLFPDINTSFIRITTVDPTAAVPEEVERTITIPLEENLASVDGVIQVRSFSQSNLSTIFLEIDSDIDDPEPVLNRVRQAIDRTRSELPASAEDPIPEEFDIPMPLLVLAVNPPPSADIRAVRVILDDIERKLAGLPGVSDVLVDGLPDREVWVELDPFRFEPMGLTFNDIATAVARRSLNQVGGRMNTDGGQRLVRVVGEIQEAAELETLPIRELNGRTVLLRDVASIKETTEEAETLGRANLQDAITYTLVKKKGADAIDVVRRARRVFEELSAGLPEDFRAFVVSDSTKFINTRIETVLSNGAQSLLIVTVLLVLFLHWRLALLVGIGIPISFAGTFLVLYLMGETLNLLSLFAMIMALGMVVDDALVIAENCYRYIEKGFSPVEAAIRGTQEVIWPVVGSVSTTVAAFLPLLIREGIIGKFLAVVPIVVVSVLLFSLYQAFLVLPSHIADFVRKERTAAQLERLLANQKNWLRRSYYWVGLVYTDLRWAMDQILSKVLAIYVHLLTIALRFRYISLLCFVMMLVGFFAAAKSGVIRFKLFNVDWADLILIKADLPPDTSLEQTARIVQRLEERIVAELPRDDLRGITTRIGARLDDSERFVQVGTNLAMITVDIDEENPACRPASEIERHLQTILTNFPEFTDATAKKQEGGPPVGKAVNVEILGRDFDVLKEMASEVEAFLTSIDGVSGITRDMEPGKTELRIRVDEVKAAQSQLDVAEVATAIRGAFRGLEAARIRWGNDEVTLRVKMDERFRGDPDVLANIRLTNRLGQPVPLAAVATIERTTGPTRIIRNNQRRQLTVSADVEPVVITSAEVNQMLREKIPSLTAAHPGYEIRLTGENEDTEKSLGAMTLAAMVAIFLIYALLATITNSFVEPFIIMAVIPFGIVGVGLGLIFMGEPLGLMSIMGTIALAGIIVNNSVVFVDFINRYRHSHEQDTTAHPEGENPRSQPRHLTRHLRWHSILASGKTRFRPIFLTTATTIGGLFGLAFATSGREQFLAPMAQAIVWGLSFGSFITLILIPCLYAIVDDLIDLTRRLFRKSPGGTVLKSVESQTAPT